MKKTIYSLICLALVGCFSRSAAMTAETFDGIQIGTPAATLEAQVGKPYRISD
ncbi:MAG: hypothetical protein HYZ48_05625, partial [Chlamydiales bacterium]|nr:hypothetical protein [Chlamydiales bacterium]